MQKGVTNSRVIDKSFGRKTKIPNFALGRYFRGREASSAYEMVSLWKSLLHVSALQQNPTSLLVRTMTEVESF